MKFLGQEVVVKEGNCDQCDFYNRCGYGFRAFEECDLDGSKECYKKEEK